MARTTDDLVKIVSFGGGVIFDASSRTIDDLVKIVSFASKSAPLVILRNCENKQTDDLVRIASFAKGKVIFEL